jgi:hypothetical protein
MMRMMLGSSVYRPRYPVASIFQFLRWAMVRSTAERVAEICLLVSWRLLVRSWCFVRLRGVIAVVP